MAPHVNASLGFNLPPPRLNMKAMMNPRHQMNLNEMNVSYPGGPSYKKEVLSAAVTLPHQLNLNYGQPTPHLLNDPEFLAILEDVRTPPTSSNINNGQR